MDTNRILNLLLVLLSFFTPACFVLETLQTNALPHYSLEENDEYIVIWHRTDISMDRNYQRPSMAGAPGRIIVNGNKAQTFTHARIYGLNSLDGDEVWTTSVSGSGEIITEGEHLYFGAIGWAKIVSYKTENGELVWSTSLPWAHSVTDLYFAQNKIFAHTNDSEFFILSEDGKILSNYSEVFRVFLEMDNVLYMESLLSIKAVDTSSGQELWRIRLDDDYTHAPIFDDETIFIRTQSSSPTYVYSIDRVVGTVNWKVSDNMLSNLYLAGNKIYYVSQNSFLVSIDRSTGREISRVKFVPDIDLNSLTGGFFITGDPSNDIIAVSFEGNRQIMGIKLVSP